MTDLTTPHKVWLYCLLPNIFIYKYAWKINLGLFLILTSWATHLKLSFKRARTAFHISGVPEGGRGIEKLADWRILKFLRRYSTETPWPFVYLLCMQGWRESMETQCAKNALKVWYVYFEFLNVEMPLQSMGHFSTVLNPRKGQNKRI